MQIAYKYLLPFCTGLQNVFTPIDIFCKILYYCISEIIQERSESLAWQFNGTQAVFIQIADRLRRDIVNGIYLPDTQIPTVRQLAFDASVNPVIARSGATWQSPATAVQLLKLYQEIAAAWRPRNDSVILAGRLCLSRAFVRDGRRGHDPSLQGHKKKSAFVP